MNFTEAKAWVKAQPKQYVYMGAAVVVVVITLLLVSVAGAQTVIAPGGSATVTCTACPAPGITRGQHHFAWHITTVKATNSVETCKACHGADLRGGTAVAHGDRVWLAKSNFVGPKACYVNPYTAGDPYGLPAEVCSGGKVAVFKATVPPTQVSCSNCHDKIKAGGVEYVLR